MQSARKRHNDRALVLEKVEVEGDYAGHCSQERSSGGTVKSAKDGQWSNMCWVLLGVKCAMF